MSGYVNKKSVQVASVQVASVQVWLGVRKQEVGSRKQEAGSRKQELGIRTKTQLTDRNQLTEFCLILLSFRVIRILLINYSLLLLTSIIRPLIVPAFPKFCILHSAFCI